MSGRDSVSRFDEIYDATNKAVLGYITAKCGRVADIGDIFQETYMELYRVLCERGTDYITHPKAFAMRLAKRKIARYYSLAARLRNFISLSALREDAADGEHGERAGGFCADDFLVEDFSVNSTLIEAMRQYMEAKPEPVQKVFYLMYDVGLTIPEIAEALNMTESNVKNRLYRTIKELRAQLKGEE